MIGYEYFEELDSTNDELKRRLAEAALPAPFTVLSAGTQTGGRGRAGHVWASPKDVSVSTSMVVYPDGLPDAVIPRLTILAAVAVAEAIETLYCLPAQIKWVNDVLLAEKKVCGILAERVTGAKTAVIIGIGINVHPGSYPPELASAATCIDEALQKDPTLKITSASRKNIVQSLWERFVTLYEQFCTCSNVSFILADYNRRLVNAGRTVRVSATDTDAGYLATALCIDENGRLIVETADGERRAVDSGEVHVRGIYGYV